MTTRILHSNNYIDTIYIYIPPIFIPFHTIHSCCYTYDLYLMIACVYPLWWVRYGKTYHRHHTVHQPWAARYLSFSESKALFEVERTRSMTEIATTFPMCDRAPFSKRSVVGCWWVKTRSGKKIPICWNRISFQSTDFPMFYSWKAFQRFVNPQTRLSPNWALKFFNFLAEGEPTVQQDSYNPKMLLIGVKLFAQW